MKNIFSTWICLDDQSTASYFPSSKGLSSDKKIQDIYWRCLLVSLFTARKYNPNITLAVFSNCSKLPIVEGVNFAEIFKTLGVDFYTTAFEYQTPEGYYKGWRNQFYEFSIFKFITEHTDFNPTDNFCLVDSDCIINGNLDKMFHDIAKYKSISYDLPYDNVHDINGNSRTEMKAIFNTLIDIKIEKTPTYYAGEYFGATVETIGKLMIEFKLLWPKLLSLHQQGLPRLHEEAHVLSFLYYQLGIENNIANQYIKRIWTDPTTLRDVVNQDMDLLIWHLPAEKRYGFKKMFHVLKCYQFNPELITLQVLKTKSMKLFSVPAIIPSRKIFFLIKKLGKILLNK